MATVRELMRFNGTLSELTLRGKISGLLGHGQNHRCCKLNYNHRPASASHKDERCSTTHTRPLKVSTRLSFLYLCYITDVQKAIMKFVSLVI